MYKIFKNKYFKLLIFISALCVASIYFIKINTSPEVFPRQEWERIKDPSALNYSKEKLNEISALLDSLPSTGLVVTVSGKILFEHGDISEKSYVASVRKSILSMLYGKYVANKTIDLDKTLADLDISDHQDLTENERKAKISDLLSARSGVYHPAANLGDNFADAPTRGSKKPGEYFLYNNWDFNVLGYIFEKETGKNIYDAFQSDIANKIGMQDFDRSIQNKTGDLTKSRYPAYHLKISARDLARLGHLMLREGKWEKEQLIPRDWVKKITSKITPANEMNPEKMRTAGVAYGYLWWVFEDHAGFLKGAYTASGAGGQKLTVIPELDMVVAHKNNQKETKNALSSKEYLLILQKIFDARNSI